MDFPDFAENPQELVGKIVLYEHGFSYGNVSRSLIRIESVTKTGFKLSGKPDKSFNLINGNEKRSNGKMDGGLISNCQLMTEEDAIKLSKEWKQKREEKALSEEIKQKIETITFEQLQQIKSLIL